MHSRNGHRLLLDHKIITPRLELVDKLSIFEKRSLGLDDLAPVGSWESPQAFIPECIVGEPELLAGAQCALGLLLESRVADHAQGDHHHAHVDDVAAIAAMIPADQLEKRSQGILTAVAPAGPG